MLCFVVHVDVPNEEAILHSCEGQVKSGDPLAMDGEPHGLVVRAGGDG